MCILVFSFIFEKKKNTNKSLLLETPLKQKLLLNKHASLKPEECTLSYKYKEEQPHMFMAKDINFEQQGASLT